jgi:hypothetical protein
MLSALTIPVAADSLVGRDLLEPLGGVAALLAMVGMLFLLPLFISQRREIERLIEWMNRDPEAGTREFTAIAPPTPAPGMARQGGYSPAARRVTSERPALERVGTSEQQALALEQAPRWRRMIVRGPRHPLVIALVAVAVAVGIFFAFAHFLRAGDEGGKGAPIDPGAVSVVVLNASTSSGLAGDLSDQLTAGAFDVAGTSVANDGIPESVVKYSSADSRREAKAVAKALGISSIEPFDAEAEAAAGGADVVVVAGDDIAKASGGQG